MKEVERLCGLIDITLPLMLEEASTGDTPEEMTKILAERLKKLIRDTFLQEKAREDA